MKDKLFLGLIFLLLVVSLLVWIVIPDDSDEQILKTEADAISYLKEKYPEEDFEILEVQEIETNKKSLCGNYYKLNEWLVKSKMTGITFSISDTYIYNSYDCGYEVESDYKKAALKYFSKINEDDKIRYGQYEIIFKKEKFSSNEELAKVVYEAVLELNNFYPFKYDDVYVLVNIYIRENEYKVLSSKEIDSVEYVLNAIKEM